MFLSVTQPKLDPNHPFAAFSELSSIIPQLESDLAQSDVDFGMEDVLTAIHELKGLSSEISTLDTFKTAMESHGLNAGMLAVFPTDLIKSTTALVSASESIGPSVLTPTDATTVAAIEGVVDTIKEKLKSWGAKVVNVVKRICIKLHAVIKRSLKKLSELGSKVVSLGADAFEKTKETVKAHPYASVAAAVGAIVIIGGLVLTFWGPGIPATAAAATKMAQNFAGALKSKTGFVDYKVAADGTIDLVKGKGFKEVAAPGTLLLGGPKGATGGWSVAKLKDLFNRLTSFLSSFSVDGLLKSVQTAWYSPRAFAVKSSVAKWGTIGALVSIWLVSVSIQLALIGLVVSLIVKLVTHLGKTASVK